jgi:hypothetical protein
VPSLVGAVTLAARRWGPRIGGWLTAIPIVTGPILCFLAVDQGVVFGGRAAQATLAGVTGLGAFCVAYAYACRRLAWPLSLVAGWTAFGAVTALLYFAQPTLIAGLVLALLASIVGERLIPRPTGVPATSSRPSHDLIIRMLATGTLVVVVTAVAAWLGPSLSGLLTAFPTAIAIIAAFSHAQGGPNAVQPMARSFMRGLKSFALFCFVFGWAIVPLGLGWTVVIAAAAQMVVHGLTLWTMTRGQRSG